MEILFSEIVEKQERVTLLKLKYWINIFWSPAFGILSDEYLLNTMSWLFLKHPDLLDILQGLSL